MHDNDEKRSLSVAAASEGKGYGVTRSANTLPFLQLQVLDNMAEGVAISDDQGCILYTNPSEDRMLGFDRGELVGQHLSVSLAEEEQERTSQIRDHLLLHGFWEGERCNRKKNGASLYTKTRITTTEIEGRSYQLRVQTAIVGREALQYAAIVESSNDAIISKDLNGIITSWNRAAETIFGYTAAEAVGRHISMLAGPDLGKEMPSILDRIRQGERIEHYETRRRRKDGKTITVSLTVSPVRNAQGKIIGASKIARDVTAERSIQRELLLLIEASKTLLAAPQSVEVLRTIFGLAQQFVSAHAYAVWRRQPDGSWKIGLSAGLSEKYVQVSPVGVSFDHLFQSGPIVLEDVQSGSLPAERQKLFKAEGISSMLVVPLHIRSQLGGTVAFYWKTTHQFSASEVRIASALGNLAAAALHTSELYELQIASTRQAEWSDKRSTFLAEAGFMLSSSLDYEVTLTNVARLAVPDLADWCTVDILNEREELQRVAVQHSDPDKIRLAHEFRKKYPPRADDVSQLVLRTGKPLLVEDIPDQSLSEWAQDAEELQTLRELGLTSILVVPMLVGQETLGVISWISAESGRRYTQADLKVAEELGRRAATAVAHARLYRNVQASEERLRLAVEAAGLGIWEYNFASGKLTASAQCKRSIGIPPDQPLDYGDFLGRIHHEDRALWTINSYRTVTDRDTFEIECRIWWPDGSLHWLLTHGRCLYEDGLPERLIGITVDVTERRQFLAQEQQARRTAELLNSIGPLLLSELNPEKLVQKITDVATALVGAEFGALFYNNNKGDGDHPPLLYSLSGTARDRFRKEHPTPHTALAGPTLRGEVTVRLDDITNDPRYWQEFPFPGILHGQLPVRSYLAVPVKSRTGKILGALFFGHQNPRVFTEEHEQIVSGIAAQAAIALDNAQLFDESAQTQQALRRFNEDLRRANEDLNQFAYSASHDLQEPLRMVAIYSQMLERKYSGQLDDNARDYIQHTVQGAKRMEQLVRDLLAYTQAANLSNGEVSAVSATAVLDKVLLNLKPSIDENGASVLSLPLPAIRVKEVHLIQLFQNLIANAIKYRKPDLPPRIEISCHAAGGFYEFHFSDNGIGIPAPYHKQIFGIFKRLHTSDQYSGTGIGLAICQRIVERYGGRIWVESDERQGSCFCFTLPDPADQPK